MNNRKLDVLLGSILGSGGWRRSVALLARRVISACSPRARFLGNPGSRGFRPAGLEVLECRQLLAATPVITELMARNDGGLRDGDGRSSDWIEVHNPSDQTVDLAGYHLTDQPDDRAKWTFPSIRLDPGQYLVVFASGHSRGDYVDRLGYLHTNFTLRRSGQYLALTAPDGTVVSQFGGPSASYPEQRANVAYGLAQSRILVDSGSEAWYQVPLGPLSGTAWTAPDFQPDEAGFTRGTAAIGMETAPDGRGSFVGQFDTVVPDNIHAVYARMTFALQDHSAITRLQLRLKYDNGFVAYLNGVPVARDNAPANLDWFSTALANSRRDSEATEFQTFDLTDHRDALVDAVNVLAIHALNNMSDKGDLLLVPELVATVSDMRAAVGTDAKLGYLPHPTPGAPNGSNADVFSGFVSDTTFSVNRGFFDRPQQVEISTTTPGARIYYTTDGSPPTATNSAASLYTGPVPVTTTTVLRAAALKDDFLPTNIDTQTYIFLQDVIHQPRQIDGFPNDDYGIGGSRSVPRDSEMDPAIVNDPRYREEIIDSLMAIPALSLVADPDDIFGRDGFYDGADVEKPVSVEVLYADDPGGNHQADAGIESHSHQRLKRSLRLNFRRQYGDAKWETDLLQRGPLHGDTAVDRLDHVILRGGNNRSWARIWNPDKTAYTIDEFYRASQIDMSGYGARGSFVHLYINGVYWGLYNPVERPDSSFTSAYFGGDRDDWFANNHSGDLRGDDARFDYLVGTLARRDLRVASNYAELQQYLDVEGFCDYLILSWWFSVSDWPQNNWYAGNRNDTSAAGPTPFRFFAWDGEWSWDAPHSSVSNRDHRAWVNPVFRQGGSGSQPMVRLWHALRQNQDFMTLFADRVYQHVYHDGALADGRAQQRWRQLNDFVRQAVVAESARWGDALQSLGQPTRTRDVDWQREVDAISQLIGGNGDALIRALRNEGYYPDTQPPDFSPYGGVVPKGFRLEMVNPNRDGTVYFTTDRSDPRASGGAVSDTAIAYREPIDLTEDVTVVARVLRDGQWSAAARADFLIASDLPLRITEINYNPHAANLVPGLAEEEVDNDRFEFIELANIGTSTIQLGGVRLAQSEVRGDVQGVRFTFAPQQLAPGQRIVVVRDRKAFQSRYGTAVRIAAGDDGDSGDPGQYGGRLANEGEQLTLVDATGRVIQQFRYGNSAPWPARASGRGSSLEILDPVRPASDPGNWQSSLQFGGSPGEERATPVGGVMINEVMARPAPGQTDWVELRNVSPRPVDVSRWYVGNAEDEYFAARIPESAAPIPPLGYGVISLSELGLDLRGAFGDSLWLLEADKHGRPLRFVDHVRFQPSPLGVSVGPGPTADAAWVPLARPTAGQPNAGPLAGDVVISEVYYDAKDPDGEGKLKAEDFQFVELYNRTDHVVDVSGWQLAGNVEFPLASDTTIDPGQTLLIVGFDPTRGSQSSIFQFMLSAAPGVPLLGPYTGPEGQGPGWIQLVRPNSADTDALAPGPPIMVDRVEYQATPPWPTTAAGFGDSLTRTGPAEFGRLPSSWIGATPSPGTVQLLIRRAGDADQDGDFDRQDIVLVLQAGKYLTGEPATWSEGDWTGDGLFDPLDLVAAAKKGAGVFYLDGGRPA